MDRGILPPSDLEPSGLSATHEEFHEARDRGPVLVFVQSDITLEPEQAFFINEVEAWESGYMREGFTTPADLQAKVTRALYRLGLSKTTAPFNFEEVLARALAGFTRVNRFSHRGEMLTVAVFGGPSQTILRPSEMEDTVLAEKLEQKALYDADRIFVRTEGTDAGVEDGKLVVKQKGRDDRLIQLDGRGGILFRLPLERNAENRLGVIVTETVQEYLQKALRYAIWLLDEIDSTQRLSHLVVVSSLAGGMGMITRARTARQS